VSCSQCDGGKAAGYLGGSDNGALSISGVRSDADGVVSTLQIRFANGDSSPRYAAVTVNGGQRTKVAFAPTGGEVRTSVVNAQLRKGSANEVVIAGVDGGWAPDVDLLVVPVS
jgi:hypothetical protein